MTDIATATQVTSEVAAPPQSSLSRQTRLFGLLILLAASFVTSIVNSTLDFVSPHPTTSRSDDIGYSRLLIKQITCLALLVYVLNRNGEATSDIGFKLRPSDLAHAGLLILAYSFVRQLPSEFATTIYTAILGHSPTPYSSTLAGVWLPVAILLAFVNPFFEELIVRAFLISEVVLLTGSRVFAVVLSVLLQTSYHLYQGIPNAVGHGCVFLMFSLYYVRTRRAWPIILAHMYADVYWLVYHSQRIG